LIGLVLHAVDGTKIETAASKQRAYYRKDLQKIVASLDRIIDEVMQQTETESDSDGGIEYRLPEHLHDGQELRGMIEERIREMNKQNRNQVMPSDGDSRMMKLSDSRKRFGYNAQAVVDDQSGLIVAQDVVNDESDNYQLIPMLEQVKENLGEVAEENLADGGYKAPSQMAKAEDKKYSVLLNMGKPPDGDGDYSARRFVYDEAKDHCVCPRGEILSYWKTKSKDRMQPTVVRIYRCQSFAECPVRWLCSESESGRTIEIGPHHQALERQRIKQQDPLKAALLNKRGQIVERIFGWIKEGFGFRRWTVRGLDNVRTQWSLISTAVNLRILYRSWLNRQLSLKAQLIQ
jgi:hypothetical protein